MEKPGRVKSTGWPMEDFQVPYLCQALFLLLKVYGLEFGTPANHPTACLQL